VSGLIPKNYIKIGSSEQHKKVNQKCEFLSIHLVKVQLYTTDLYVDLICYQCSTQDTLPKVRLKWSTLCSRITYNGYFRCSSGDSSRV